MEIYRKYVKSISHDKGQCEWSLTILFAYPNVMSFDFPCEHKRFA